MRIHGFPPIATEHSRILVLGTMPGLASLQARQYYAHPRNTFWKIMGEIVAFDAGQPYDARTSSMAAAGIALWDVLQSCTREGSLDSDIDQDTILLNDFAGFFSQHPCIHRVCFNGAKAESLYRKHIQPFLEISSSMEYIRLPSTSPANATMPLDDKLRAWKGIASAI